MNYKHILVMIDLSSESYFLMKKASLISSFCDTKISIIYINVNYSNMYPGLIDVDSRHLHVYCGMKQISNILKSFKDYIFCPIYKTFLGNGDLVSCLLNVIKKYNIDLVIFGHYQDFWSKMLSSVRQIINSLHIDMLVVPFRPYN
ncbi:MAG: universal stress protein [Buchnera aphidicola (Chaetogeoica yunlongensis)]